PPPKTLVEPENCAQQTSDVFETSEVSAEATAQLLLGMRMTSVLATFGFTTI
ncbi:MAG: hypothetical protein FD138_4728, partial [Planctomycetota bacterium]